MLGLADDVTSRAREVWPQEPVRTLDAIHLATATLFARAIGELTMLSLDQRVRANASALGWTVVPA